MTGFSDYAADKILNFYTGKTAIGSIPTAYIALYTVAPSDTGGGTEVSGSGYARVATAASDWNAASGSAPSSTSNAASIAFPAATGSWGTILAFGAFDASTSGNLLWFDYLGNYVWKPATVTLASPGVIIIPAHGYSNGDNVIFSTEYGGASPTFSSSNFTGTLVVANVTTDTFTVTNAAAAVNTSSTGNGMFRKITTQSIISGVVASFAGGSPGDLVLSLA